MAHSGGSLAIDYWGHGYSTGYGIAAQRLVRALVGEGVSVRWRPIDFSGGPPHFPSSRASHGGLDARRRKQPPGKRPDVVVLHAPPEVVPAALAARGSAPLVIHTVWELDYLPPTWPVLINQCDLVVVPTEWNATIFRKEGVTVPIHVVPHVRAADIESDTAWLDRFGDRFLVYTIATWSKRKAPWRAVEAFARAFSADDRDVVLVVKTDPTIIDGVREWSLPAGVGHSTWAALAQVLGRVGPAPEVVLMADALTDAQVQGLHTRGDCWVALPSAEGWDLGTFDAAVMGTPVVTTAHAAPLVYLDPEASGLVPARQVAADLKFLSVDDRAVWADPDVGAAADALREVRADHAGARARAATQAEQLAETYAPGVVAREFLAAIDEVLR